MSVRDNLDFFFVERLERSKPRKKDGKRLFRARIKTEEGREGMIVANLFAETQDELNSYIQRFNAIDITGRDI